jgi:hypothetical protein
MCVLLKMTGRFQGVVGEAETRSHDPVLVILVDCIDVS